MTIRSILLFAPAETAKVHQGPVTYAISLAKAQGAQLTVLCFELDVTTPGVRADANAKANEIADAAECAGVTCEVITTHSHAIGVSEVVAEHARLHDLVISGAGHTGLLSEGRIAEGLLFGSGRPVLLVPASHTAPYAAGPVAVAWDNSAKAARALGDAITLLDVDAVDLLAIDGEKSWQTDMEPDAVIAAMGRRGVRAEYHSAELQGRAIGDALADEAERAGATLLVMGAFAHSRLRQLVLGGATAEVLDAPRMPTLLSH